MRTDGRTDMTKLIVAKNETYFILHGTGLSCSLGGIFHGVGCTACVCV
jgi:hypothetical protein